MQRLILVIEDDEVLNRVVVDELSALGYAAHGVHRWADAARYLERTEPDLILLDCRLPDADGIELLKRQAIGQQTVVVLTAYGSVRNAVDAMRAGAAEYLVKPVNLDELELVVRRALENAALRRNQQFLRSRLGGRKERGTLVGVSPTMRRVEHLIEMVAPTDATVLIQGESGVGKEVVAWEIFRRSSRAEGNFLTLDCCTLKEQLFESELFGHEKGAFTGADRQKKGLIEGVEEGTLFLDEIGEIGPAIQAKLLRVLETGQYRRVGGNKDLRADVRIVAATNRDLQQMSESGDFRSDLFYRLSVFVIDLPPLRERREDIPLLVEHFIRNHDFSRRIDKRVVPAAMQQLVAYDWPGNVRELRNVMERAIILSGEQQAIGPEHLAFGSRGTQQRPGALALAFESEPSLEQVEEKYVRYLLTKYSGHRATVAKILGVSERTLYRLLQRYEE